MTPTEHPTAKTSSSKTAPARALATLYAFLRRRRAAAPVSAAASCVRGGADVAPGSRRWTVLLATLLTAAASLALLAPPALATPQSHLYVSRITGLRNAGPVTVDPAGHPWVSTANFLEGPVAEYGLFPSTTQIGEPPTSFDDVGGLAFSSLNGNLYVADPFSGNVTVFEDGTGPLLETLEFGSFGRPYYLGVAADNSTPPTGRFYVSGAEAVKALESNGTERDFTFSPPGNPGEYDYISGNEITGTPAGAFAELFRGIATGADGTIYVIDRASETLDEFAPSGEFISKITGADVPGGFASGGASHLELSSVAIDPTDGNILIADASAGVIYEFEPSGHYVGQLDGGEGAPRPFGDDAITDIAVDSSGDLYVSLFYSGEVFLLKLNPVYPTFSYQPITDLNRDSADLHATVGPREGGPITECRFEYGTNTEYTLGSEQCLNGEGHPIGTEASPITEPTPVHLDLSAKLHANTTHPTYHYRLVVKSEKGGVIPFADDEFETPPAVTGVETGEASPITNEGATLHASFTAEAGIETEYFFEYGTSSNFGHKEPLPSGLVPQTATGTQNLSTAVEHLVPNTTYHYRIVAENEFGTTAGDEREFTTYQAPTIEGLSSSEVTATSAVLHAKINPNGLPAGTEAECRFEYGPTTAYGTEVPCLEKLTGTAGLPVEVQLEGLQPGATYHYRLTAESRWGTVTSEDQSFEFFPPACPNSAVRQQTGSAYLPDCRAYELVSPQNANGTVFFPFGPNPGTATSPSRFSYVGDFSAPPGAEDVIGTSGDLYVATRTDTGWVSHYVGIPGNQAACDGGPPTDPFNNGPGGPVIQNSVATDPSMSRFLDWEDGIGDYCMLGPFSATSDLNDLAVNPSDAPYLWDSEGSLLARLPTAFASNPAAPAALNCPTVESTGGRREENFFNGFAECSGEVTASGDLSHLIFSSRSLSFSEPGALEGEGLTKAPGSAYDQDLATGKLTLISRLPDHEPIPQDPSFASVPRQGNCDGIKFCPGGAEEFLRFPAVSTDGSHVLISTATVPLVACEEPYFGANYCPRYTEAPIHLYMSIDDAAAIEIAPGHAVTFAGMTSDGSKVFFTSPEHLTGEDTEHLGASLYMWSEQGEKEGHPLTLISKGDNEGKPGEPGDTGNCSPAAGEILNRAGEKLESRPWTTKCGIALYSAAQYAAHENEAKGGNGISDTPIASAAGDIYFFSPEQLVGDRGVLGLENLYDYHAGSLHFVAAFPPGSYCAPGFYGQVCTDGPIVRFEVTSDGSHMALVTTARLTSYDNAGHLEMYSYTPATGNLVCDSCNPDGKPATADVEASQDGLFLTDDGRTFFSTAESLVPSDTDEAPDVYEFVDGHPRLITPGTGIAHPLTREGQGTITSSKERPGLIGVSASGTDVYFSTFDVLLSEDHNGNFLKFYDARTDGGFPQPPPTPPCEAAEECHGPGTEPPTLPTQGTAATLTGGNANSGSHTHHKKHHKRAKHKRHGHRANAKRGGGK